MIHAVLFDLGDTLIYHSSSWRQNMAFATRALAESICSHGVSRSPAEVDELFSTRLNSYMSEREKTFAEHTTCALVREIFTELGLANAPDAHIRAALDAFYTITQENWLPEADALPTLQALHTQGFRLGIVSNAGDDQDVRQLVEKIGATPLFDFILTSAACGIRKPHPDIFKRALSHWTFTPHEVMMVGDRLDTDVIGANRLGIVSTWIKRRSRQSLDVPDAPQPAFVIEALSELPGILAKEK